jgi:hypothetical protein
MPETLTTMPTDQQTTTASTADAAVLDQLQDRMERIIRGETPNAGRFCGYCYARLNPESEDCPVCGRSTAAVAPVARVPRAALRVYNAYRRKMQVWVNTFAFTGIFLACVISWLIYAGLPNPWSFLSVATLFFGSWYLANLLGGGLGAAIGVPRGRTARDEQWRALLERRAAGENLDAG